MSWLVATLLLAAAGLYVVWPLVRHWQAPSERPPGPGYEALEAELEELQLDVAAGRLSELEAAVRRRELRR